MASLLHPAATTQIALITPHGNAVSYDALRADARQSNTLLQARSLLFLVGYNDYALVRWYVTAFEYGHVVLLLPPDIATSELGKLIDLYQPRYFICAANVAERFSPPARFQPVWSGARELALEPNEDALLATSSTSIPKTAAPYQAWQNEYPQPELYPELAFLSSTSGSTGSPKLVRLSQQNLISNATSIANYLHLNASERAIAHLPLSYSFGLSILNSHLIAGSSVVLCNAGIMEREFWQAVENHGVTSFSGVPYHYEMLFKLRFARLKTYQIRTMTQAGGPLALPLLQQLLPTCQEKQIRFVVMYGQTEASPRITYVPPERLAEKLGSIGIAIPGGQLWLRNEHGERVMSAEGQGELMYEGRNVGLGYATQAQHLADGDDFNGVLATGDLACRDTEGFYFITGRLKRFLKLFGNRISLDQVEQWLALQGVTAVATGTDDALIVYLVDERHFEAATLARSTDDNNEIDTTAWLANWRIAIADFCHVHFSAIRVQSLSEIPRLPNGKVDYNCLTK